MLIVRNSGRQEVEIESQPTKRDRFPWVEDAVKSSAFTAQTANASDGMALPDGTTRVLLGQL